MNREIHLGTCSWKHPSWRGLVYSNKPDNYLHEYARRYDCVEIDQWFYSLFKDEVVLPKPNDMAESGICERTNLALPNKQLLRP